ncbi:hypothetical protein N0V91_009344 [Didymella pomorum]|uniref:NmrA-like domain-containing protein n=1 Tax=Didymella pomorum TaxID=749634 RepID=A0A9W8Z5N4_9PLEO|nr:hypothetical protein N0V91_009344 [Didymella pomorum]
MSSHADNYRLPSAFGTIALLGANGQIGDRIFNAQVSSKHKDFKIIAFAPPGSESQQLAQDLEGVDATTALNGSALEAQGTIQDAAADAGVQRF